MKTTHLKRTAIAAAVASGLAAMPLQAQMLEEVVVTATKRAVGMQDVPIALSVMSGEKIADAGIGNLEDMAVFMPNVHIAEGSTSDAIFIRGIGSGTNFGFEQSVGTFIDGVYFGRAQASKSAFLDIERVEVLKGSQSTLFGKNTIAGAINITTAKPTDEFEGSVELRAEPEFGGQTGTLTLSGPITDNFGARLVLQDHSEDGWMENVATGEDEMQRDNQVARITLAWQPTDDLDLTLKYENSQLESVGSNEVISIATPSAASFYTAADPNFPQTIGDEYKKSARSIGSPRDGEDFRNIDSDIFTLTAEWALGEHTIKSITGYVDFEIEDVRDTDYSAILGINRGRQEDHKQFTQEFILTSPESDTFEYLAGLYYQDEELQHDRYTDVQLSEFFNAGVPLPAVVGTGFADGTGINNFNQDSETLSAFFQGTFHISDTLRLITGIRYSEDEKKFDKIADINGLFLQSTTADILTEGPSNDTIAGIYDSPSSSGGLDLSTVHDFNNGTGVVCKAATLTSTTCTASPLNTERKEEHWTGDVTVQWDFSDETMLYAKAGNGYKAGGFDEDNARGSLPDQEYEDENSISIEVGAKMDLFEGRGRFNVAVFRSEFEDVQVSTFDGVSGFVVGNAAESEVEGIEMDGMYAISDELTLSAGFAYLDAAYKSYETGACTNDQNVAHTGTTPCVQDLSGSPLQFAPELAGNISLNYITEITDSLELGLSTDILYSDNYEVAGDADPLLTQDSFTKVNARISLADIDGTWSLALLGKNLTDETTSSWGNDIPLGSLGFAGSYQQVINAPRSYEIQAKYNF